VRELFVYYRVHVGRETQALVIVDAFQARLKRQVPGLVARLLHRPDESGRTRTWMEVYAVAGGLSDAGVDDELQRTIETFAAALADCIDGVRHTEVFVPVARA
jgi:Domain of unknown function (DUF4936)